MTTIFFRGVLLNRSNQFIHSIQLSQQTYFNNLLFIATNSIGYIITTNHGENLYNLNPTYDSSCIPLYSQNPTLTWIQWQFNSPIKFLISGRVQTFASSQQFINRFLFRQKPCSSLVYNFFMIYSPKI